MSVALSFLGTEWTSPDHAIGFGTAINNPSTALSSMITGQLYYQEGAGDRRGGGGADPLDLRSQAPIVVEEEVPCRIVEGQ